MRRKVHSYSDVEDENDLARQVFDLRNAMSSGLNSIELSAERREAMRDQVTQVLSSVEEHTRQWNTTLNAVTQRFEEATRGLVELQQQCVTTASASSATLAQAMERVAELLETSAASNNVALVQVAEQLSEVQRNDKQSLHEALTQTAERLVVLQQTQQQELQKALADVTARLTSIHQEQHVEGQQREDGRVRLLSAAQTELREALAGMTEQVKRAARRPKAAWRDAKSGEWRFDYGQD